MGRDVAKIVGMAASGVPPAWDLMVVTDAHHCSLWTRKLHVPFDYKTLGVDDNGIQYDSGTVSIANQMILPAYNVLSAAAALANMKTTANVIPFGAGSEQLGKKRP